MGVGEDEGVRADLFIETWRIKWFSLALAS